MAHADYESWGIASAAIEKPVLLEAYSGVAIVAWYGTIERQLEEMIEKSEANRNHPYADQIRQFLKTWRENEISGSINREVLEVLKSAAAQLAVSEWKHANYFSNLRDQLRKLIASEEELPREPMAPPKKGGRSSGMPEAPTGDYGPTDDAPSAEAGETSMGGSNNTSAGGNSNI